MYMMLSFGHSETGLLSLCDPLYFGTAISCRLLIQILNIGNILREHSQLRWIKDRVFI